MVDAGKRVVHPTNREELPDDPELLKEMVLQLAQSNEELAQKVAWFQRPMWGKQSERLPEIEPADQQQHTTVANDDNEAEVIGRGGGGGGGWWNGGCDRL